MTNLREHLTVLFLTAAFLMAIFAAAGTAAQVQFNPKEFKLDDKATWKASQNAQIELKDCIVQVYLPSEATKMLKVAYRGRFGTADMTRAKLERVVDGRRKAIEPSRWKSILKPGVHLDLQGTLVANVGVLRASSGLVRQ